MKELDGVSRRQESRPSRQPERRLDIMREHPAQAGGGLLRAAWQWLQFNKTRQTARRERDNLFDLLIEAADGSNFFDQVALTGGADVHAPAQRRYKCMKAIIKPIPKVQPPITISFNSISICPSNADYSL